MMKHQQFSFRVLVIQAVTTSHVTDRGRQKQVDYRQIHTSGNDEIPVYEKRSDYVDAIKY